MFQISAEIQNIILTNHNKNNNRNWSDIEEAKKNYNMQALIESLKTKIEKKHIDTNIKIDEVSHLFTDNEKFINFLICDNLLINYIHSAHQNNDQEIKEENNDALIEIESLPKKIFPLIEYCDYFYENRNTIIQNNKKDIESYIGQNIGYAANIHRKNEEIKIETIGDIKEHNSEFIDKLKQPTNLSENILVNKKNYSDFLFDRISEEKFKEQLRKEYNNYKKEYKINWQKNSDYTTLNKNMYGLIIFLKDKNKNKNKN